MVSRAEVEGYVRQRKTEAEGYTDIQSENLQKLMEVELQKLMAAAAATDAKVEALGIESGRAMQLVMAESEKSPQRWRRTRLRWAPAQRASAQRDRHTRRS